VSGAAASAESIERAKRLQHEAGVLDLHVDSIIQQRLFGYDVEKRHNSLRPGQPLFWHADVPRMIDAGYAGACLGIHFFPWESERGPREANAQIDYLDRVCAHNSGVFRVHTAADWARARAAGKLALAPGVEGAHILNGSLDNLDRLLERGIAYLTLAHFSKNSAATPSMGRGANEEDRLTPFGVEVVRRLNAAGVVVDVSHLNMPCVLHAAEVCDAPLLATHSGAQSVNAHRRLLSDAAIDAIAARDGAIGIIFSPGFLKGNRTAGSEAVVEHIDTIASRVGIRHVCIGSDYDGWLPAILSDHRDCLDLVRITALLLERGYTDADVAAVLSGNARRVIEAAAARAAV